MKHCIKTILCLMAALTAVSCQVKEEMDDCPMSMPMSFVIQTRASVDKMPIVNTVRLFLFEKGVCKYNKLYGSSDIAIERDDDKNAYHVTVNDQLSMVIGSKCDIYAVLNEGGYMTSLPTGDNFSDKLSAVRVGDMNYGLFQNLLNTKFAYDPSTAVSTDEQAFVMLSYAKDVSVIPSAPDTPITVEMINDGESRRSLARLRLAKITSEPESGETADLALLAKVFVQDVRLVNVPDGYFLTSGTATGMDEVTEITIGAPGEDGYYERTWPGTVRETVSGTMSRIQSTTDRIYRMEDNEGSGSWRFGDFASAFSYSSMTHFKRYSANNGNIRNFFSSILPNHFDTHTVSTEPMLENLTRGGVVLSQTPWNIVLDHTLYIPEHLSDASDQSTGFMVRLALSDPELDMSNVPMSYWDGLSGSWRSYAFYTGTEIFEYNNESSDAFLTKYNHSCWSTDPNKIDVGGADYYKFFIGDLSRRQDKTIPDTNITPDVSGVVMNWNVPTSGSRVIDVFVPINDLDIDDDYSVRRNIMYDVTLHVKNSTYAKFPTRSSDGLPVIITATVNKVSENQ